MKIRKYVKKDVIKATSILILLLGLLTILYLSEIQSISGYGFAFPITFFFYFLHDLPPYLRTTKNPSKLEFFINLVWTGMPFVR